MFKVKFFRIIYIVTMMMFIDGSETGLYDVVHGEGANGLIPEKLIGSVRTFLIIIQTFQKIVEFWKFTPVFLTGHCVNK